MCVREREKWNDRQRERERERERVREREREKERDKHTDRQPNIQIRKRDKGDFRITILFALFGFLT